MGGYMKKCTRCNEEKKLSEFSPQKRGLLGVRARCKKCCAELSKIYREKNPEKGAKYQAEYRKKNPEKIKKWWDSKKDDKEFQEKRKKQQQDWRKNNPEYYSEWYWKNENYRKKKKEYHKKWLEKNRDSQKEASKLHKKRNPEKVRARDLLRKAVYYGKIEKPSFCQKCKKIKNRIEGHHEDYSKPYDVVWLCVSCHRKLHIRS